MRHRVITDVAAPVHSIVISLGVGPDQHDARITWTEGSCTVEGDPLTLGLWAHKCGDIPPAAVVCRATALAVGAVLKDEFLRALERLP